MKLAVTHFSPGFRHVLPLRSRYFPHHPVFKLLLLPLPLLLVLLLLLLPLLLLILLLLQLAIIMKLQQMLVAISQRKIT
jgi:hypothetical protein